jgi:hypothetical protein
LIKLVLASDSLEAFVSDVEMAMRSPALEKDNDYKPNARAKEIKEVATEVSENDQVIIPADKTNSLLLCQQTNTNRKC